MNDKTISDEELVFLSRLGDQTADASLLERYFGMRQFFFTRTVPTWTVNFDPWDFNELFLDCFLTALQSFEFRRSKFLTFFIRILARRVISFALKKTRENYNVISFDEDVIGEESTYTLHDVVSSPDLADNPAAFFEYAESLRELKRLPKEIDPIALDVVRLKADGMSTNKAARTLGISYGSVRYLYDKYRTWALGTIKKIYDLDDLGLEEEAEKLDAFANEKTKKASANRRP